MRTTEKIKSTFKEALRTKRIMDETPDKTPTVKTPTQNFDEFTKLLTPQEWKSFEDQEQCFRYITEIIVINEYAFIQTRKAGGNWWKY